MKRCPTCQKTYADTMKFCQTDGTPLVEDKPSAPPADPYKTVVGSIKSDDILQVPEAYDPMKTMVSAPNQPKPDLPKSDEPKKEEAPKEASSSTPPKIDSASPFSPPKPVSSSLNPPSFGDSSAPSSGSTSSGKTKPRSFDETFSSIEPPAFGSGKGNTSPFDKPASTPFGSPSKDDAPPTAFGSSPFDSPKASTPPPPYKEPEPLNQGGQSPFGSPQTPFGQQSNDPWAAPQDPFGQQSNDPFGSPQFGGQSDWSPPPAPVSSWQDQGLGANTPFQPPVAMQGQNQTLPIVSLVCGIVSLFCCWIGFLLGPAALITGFIGRKNATNDPSQYTGNGLALAGMICGGIGTLISIAYFVLVILGVAMGPR